MARTDEGIEYPNDYDAKADILADLEAMAASIDLIIKNLKSSEESNLANKVDKETGKSLMTDEERQKLAGLTNYDDSNIRELISDMSDTLANIAESLDSLSEIQESQNQSISNLQTNKADISDVLIIEEEEEIEDE